MLTSAGALHVRGAAVNWEAVMTGRRDRRAVLPTYPFQRTRYWFEERADPAGSDGGRLFDLQWVPQAAGSPDLSRRRWLILQDDLGTGADLAARLRARGDRVDVLPSSRLSELAGVLAEAIGADAVTPLTVVHLWSLDIATGDSDWMLALGSISLLDIVQSAAASARAPRVWLVTRGAQAVPADGAVGPDPDDMAVLQAPLWGLARVLAIEHPELFAGIVDLDPSTDAGAGPLFAEVITAGQSVEAAHRAGNRLVPRLRRAALEAGQSVALARDGVYLVTGGLGGLGLGVAEWMIAGGARRLVLVGRRSPSGEVQARLDRLRRGGATIHLVVEDISDPGGAVRAIAAADAAGSLRGIIHAAGALDDAVLVRQDAARFARAMAGKAYGALHLDRLVRGRDLEFFVLFSSMASIVGSPGQGNYAAANALLDALAAARRARGEAAVSVNWGPWAESGMVARLSDAGRATMAARGLSPLGTAQGLRLLGRVLRHGTAQVAAVAWDPAVARRGMPATALSILDTLAPVEQTIAVPSAADHTSQVAIAGPAEAAAYLRDRIGAVLRLPEDSDLAGELSLQDIGLDSMMATELRNCIRREQRVDLPIARFLGGATLHGLTADLLEHLALARITGGPAAPAGEAEEFIL